MSTNLVRVQGGKYVRARKLQEEYMRRGVAKAIIDCYVEIDLEDRAADMARAMHRGMKKGGFKL